MRTRSIDLNADLGEGFGRWRMGDDLALLDIVTSANIACGFHAGDPDIMVETAAAAKARGVAIGAHPGFADLRGFGRRVMPDSEQAIERDVAYQIGAMQACAALTRTRVAYIKVHGSLANLSNRDEAVADAIARAVSGVDRSLPLMVMPGLRAERAAEKQGLACIREIYADRGYAGDGTLLPRGEPGALVSGASTIAERVLAMLEAGAILTQAGTRIPVTIDTVCVHGDAPGAVEAARAVRAALETAGFVLAPFTAA